MTLRELQRALEVLPKDLVFDHGFAKPHSYRGNYEYLGLEPAKNVTVESMLDTLEEADGSTYTGYKGGEFTMHGKIPVYLAHYGNCGSEIVGIALVDIATLLVEDYCGTIRVDRGY